MWDDINKRKNLRSIFIGDICFKYDHWQIGAIGYVDNPKRIVSIFVSFHSNKSSHKHFQMHLYQGNWSVLTFTKHHTKSSLQLSDSYWKNNYNFVTASIIKQVNFELFKLLLKEHTNITTKLNQKLFAKVIRMPSKEAWVWIDRESN